MQEKLFVTKALQSKIQKYQKKSSARGFKFKRWNKMLRGKGLVYKTRSGTNLKIDTFHDE